MSKEIIQFDRAMFESKLDAMVREKVERIVNAMPELQADEIANAARYERPADGRRTGPATTSGAERPRPEARAN